MYKNLFIFNGFIIFSLILWNYLFRVRLPKEISADLPNAIVFYYSTMFSVAAFLLLISILNVFKVHLLKSSKITLAFYILQTTRIRYFELKEPLDCLITLKPGFIAEIMQKYNSDCALDFDYKKALIKFKNLTEHLIKLHTVFYIYERYQRTYDLWLNVVLYGVATICWGYTLFLCNIYGFPIQLYIPEDPFSGAAIY